MFYFLAKIFWVVAQPVSLAAMLVLIGLVLAACSWRKLGLLANGLAVLILAVSCFTTFGAMLIQPLENRFARPAPMPENVDTIIVLGGSTKARVSTARSLVELQDAGDRMTDAVMLARRYPQARLVYSGGAGILDPGEPEAIIAQRFFLDQGIAPERLVLENQSRDTYENAELTAAMLDDSGGTTILVTSAFHMPRSIGLFRRAGLDVIAWPTDYRSAGNEGFGLDFANPVNSLNNTTVAMREWIGLLVYSWSGRIDTILPAQISN